MYRFFMYFDVMLVTEGNYVSLPKGCTYVFGRYLFAIQLYSIFVRQWYLKAAAKARKMCSLHRAEHAGRLVVCAISGSAAGNCFGCFNVYQQCLGAMPGGYFAHHLPVFIVIEASVVYDVCAVS